jgi:type IV pilus assembly protein PilM
MNFLPKASSLRPRVACEIAPEGVVAARAGEVAGTMAAVASIALEAGALTPGLKPGNIVDRLAVVNAVRRAFEAVGAKPNTRKADVTIVIPDGACRVLLLDFDALPSKLSEALPLVRFRLKKLVPFDADDAMVTFQVMSQSRGMVRVLAVGIPRDVLAEYETVTREAGFEPGAVLPSTLAAMAGVGTVGASMLVNVSPLSVTTAIAREGILLLHRTIDLHAQPVGVPAGVPPALFETTSAEPIGIAEFAVLPVVSREETQAEWAAQEPEPEYGRDPYADRMRAEEATQNFDGMTAFPVPRAVAFQDVEATNAREPAAIADSPYAQPTVLADLTSELHNAILIAPTSPGTFTAPDAGGASSEPIFAANATGSRDSEPLPPDDFANEVAQAISVAAAYFEDTLSAAPEVVLATGSLSRAGLESILNNAGIADADGLRVREFVGADALLADASSAQVGRNALGPVWGALSA